MTRENTEVELLASRITQLARKYSDATHAGSEATEIIRSISATCTELNAVVSSPETWVERIALSYNGTVAICILLDLNIFRILLENNGSASLSTLVRSSGYSRDLLSIKACLILRLETSLLTSTRMCAKGGRGATYSRRALSGSIQAQQSVWLSIG